MNVLILASSKAGRWLRPEDHQGLAEAVEASLEDLPRVEVFQADLSPKEADVIVLCHESMAEEAERLAEENSSAKVILLTNLPRWNWPERGDSRVVWADPLDPPGGSPVDRIRELVLS